jgi:FAD/FMN-containing dehydrogenase
MPYAALQGMLDEGAPSGIRSYTRSGYVADLSDGFIEAALEHGGEMSSPFSQLHLHHMGGAVARVEASNRGFAAALAPFATGGVYVNFLGNEGEARVRAAYGDAKYDRLAGLKRRFDPENLFRLTQNIPPAA